MHLSKPNETGMARWVWRGNDRRCVSFRFSVVEERVVGKLFYAEFEIMLLQLASEPPAYSAKARPRSTLSKQAGVGGAARGESGRGG